MDIFAFCLVILRVINIDSYAKGLHITLSSKVENTEFFVIEGSEVMSHVHSQQHRKGRYSIPIPIVNINRDRILVQI